MASGFWHTLINVRCWRKCFILGWERTSENMDCHKILLVLWQNLWHIGLLQDILNIRLWQELHFGQWQNMLNVVSWYFISGAINCQNGPVSGAINCQNGRQILYGINKGGHYFRYCQAQPSPSSSFSWLAELALFSFNPATRPAALLEISFISHIIIEGQVNESK